MINIIEPILFNAKSFCTETISTYETEEFGNSNPVPVFTPMAVRSPAQALKYKRMIDRVYKVQLDQILTKTETLPQEHVVKLLQHAKSIVGPRLSEYILMETMMMLLKCRSHNLLMNLWRQYQSYGKAFSKVFLICLRTPTNSESL